MNARRFTRQLLPWLITAVALGYVFGYAIDWQAIPAATEKANLPLFISITIFDKLGFFLVWALVQAAVIRRFIEPVPTWDVFRIKGGAELVRTVNNSLADAAFLYGVAQLTHARVAAVVIVASLPFFCHFAVLLVQATIALPLLPGGITAHPGVLAVVAIGWSIGGACLIAGRFGVWTRLVQKTGLGPWLDRVSFRQLLPFFGWFALFAVFDVLIQGLATRAFGVPIPWLALAARIPILYLAISIPSLGNFGTREIAWAELFEGFGDPAALYAFALWTNVIFLGMHALIGSLFFSNAIALLRGVRKAKKDGSKIPRPFLHDASDS